MNFQWLAGSGTTVLILFAIWTFNFFRNSGPSFLWGALTGQLAVA